MKPLNIIIVVLVLSGSACKSKDKVFIINPDIIDSAVALIKLPANKFSSDFQTHLAARFYTNDELTKSIDDAEYSISSSYGYFEDTLQLVAHISDFETQALLVKFVGDRALVRFYRCSHGSSRLFRLNLKRPLEECIEVPAKYNLILSVVPDTILKPTVYGSISMESDNFYYEHELEGRKKLRVSFAFFFRSQYRKM